MSSCYCIDTLAQSMKNHSIGGQGLKCKKQRAAHEQPVIFYSLVIGFFGESGYIHVAGICVLPYLNGLWTSAKDPKVSDTRR